MEPKPKVWQVAEKILTVLHILV